MKKQLILISLALFAAYACQKETQTPESTPESGSKYPVLRADIQDTKTTLDGLSMSFVLDDEIAVFNGEKGEETHLPCRYKCTSIEGGSAIFTWDEANTEAGVTPDPDLETIVATYPYRSSSTSKFEEYGTGTLKIRMVATPSTSQTNGFMKLGVPLVASAAKGASLNFKQTVGILRITMKGTTTIKKVTMTSTDNLSGDASVSYVSAAPVLSVTGTGKTITYTYESGIALNEEDGVQLCFGLPEGTRDIDFVFTDSEDKTMTVKAKDLTITRGHITPSALTYVQDVVTTINLSEGNKWANCYVVNAAGNYCFDAKKPDGTAVSGTSAVWVWASGEACSRAYGTTLPATMMADVALEDGKIFFTVPANYAVGNVVLGIIDSNKELLYTWHVWLTSADLTDISTSGITVMDRNLGAGALYDVEVATSATPLQNGKGNYYQWGRKDPILGARNSSSGNSVTTFKDDNNSQKCNINTSAGISNVSDFWTSGGDFGGFTADLGAKFPITMAASGKVPGYIANDTTTPWSERTNANPCPYGYKVMTKAQFDALIDVSVAAAAGVGEYNTANFGQVKLAGSVIIPRTGFRSGGGGTQYGTTSARYYCDDVSSTEANKGQYYKFDWSGGGDYSGASAGTYNAYNACNVRCVKE